MIPKIKNILYATDLTENSAYAFRYAINSAQKHNAQIIILHVIEKPSPTVEGLVEMYLEKAQFEKIWAEKKDGQIKRIQERVKEVARRELASDSEMMKLIASIVVVEGDPAVEILKKTQELNCDILIMGTHGHGLISHTFLGSVAQKVLSRVTKPVFIIPIPKEETDVTFKNK
jgi:nucleotide-binding universal stress UspA family protein